MNSQNALLIFIRNPEKGKVNTRLAATIGDEKALVIYEELLRHTQNITRKLPVKKLLFYAEKITEQDNWPAENYYKIVQKNGDLGIKMQAAFESTFTNGAKKVIVIGSDCYELTEDILNQAFSELENHDAVIGPAADGGYYLLGFSRQNDSVFQNKTWSSDSVFAATIQDLENQNFKYKVLPVLNDVDEEKDLGRLRKFL
jgi:rSAM/selenodomain-associated transferase 1